MPISQIETMLLKKGEVAFLWFNSYSGLAIKTPNRILVVDPVEVNPDDFTKVSTVLITHEHLDHLDESMVETIHLNTKCCVVADSTSLSRLVDSISSEKLLEARIGDELELDGVRVNVEPSNHPAATPVSFVITSEDGVKRGEVIEFLNERERDLHSSIPQLKMRKHIIYIELINKKFMHNARPKVDSLIKEGINVIEAFFPIIHKPRHIQAGEFDQQGMPPEEIAKRLGVSRKTAVKYIHRYRHRKKMSERPATPTN